MAPIKHLFVDVQIIRSAPDMGDYATVNISSHRLDSNLFSLYKAL